MWILYTTVLSLPLASQLRVQRERTSAKVNTGKRELPRSKLCLAIEVGCIAFNSWRFVLVSPSPSPCRRRHLKENVKREE